MVVNFSNIIIFVYRQKTFTYTHLFTELRTFFGIKISVIKKKLQPSENEVYIHIFRLKKSLKIRKLFFYSRYLEFV